jgi:hypothetical protein
MKRKELNTRLCIVKLSKNCFLRNKIVSQSTGRKELSVNLEGVFAYVMCPGKTRAALPC